MSGLENWEESSFKDLIPPSDGPMSIAQFEMRQKYADLELARKRGWLEALTWFGKLCRSGSTIGMIKLAVHNKRVEISGEGERA